MRPVSPVAPELNLEETVFARDQPDYNALPAYRTEDGMVVSRWKLTWRERLRVALRGNIWTSVLTFNRPLQPMKLDTRFPLDSVVDRQPVER